MSATDTHTQVLKMIQLVNGTVLFADDEDKPDSAFSLPRAAWDALGNPTILTVDAVVGGEFVEKPKVTTEKILGTIFSGPGPDHSAPSPQGPYL